MDKSSPGARIDKWWSRIRGAWLVSIGDMAVSTLAEAQSAFWLLSDNNARSCLLTFTHPQNLTRHIPQQQSTHHFL